MGIKIGEKYGRLTAIKQVERPAHIKSGGRYFLFHCDCGTEKIIRGTSVTAGAIQSCGCLHKEKVRSNGNDLIGQRFGRLVVIEQIENKHLHRGKYWRCRCDCGNYTEVRGDGLIGGTSLSCGCLQKERAGTNKINELGNRYGKLTVVDLANSDSQGHAYWRCVCDCGNIKICKASSLRKGAILSCGCLKSKGEMRITQYLRERKINFIPQISFSDLFYKSEDAPLKFDFGIYDNNNKLILLIEFQGIQHYDSSNFFFSEENIIRDELKRKYCIDKKIPLIEIKYDEDIEEKLKFIGGDEE